MPSILIGGDVCPIGTNMHSFQKGDAVSIFNDLLSEFENAELTIINLECPLLEEVSPIIKCGPILGVDSSCINGLNNTKIDVINLANNHILDHGPKGLENTIRICTEAGISTVGVGRNLDHARQIDEFSIATDTSWGANPFDPIDFVRRVCSQRDNIDYLIVLLHGGNEHYPFPSPRLKNVCHFLVENGANAVIVQHTHCPGCYEEYNSGHIVYGQGNLIFDWPNQGKDFHQGFLVRLSIEENRASTMSIIPYVQSFGHVGVKRLDEESEEFFRRKLTDRSEAIKDDSFVLEQWLEYCNKQKYVYANRIFGYNRLLSKLNRRGLLFGLFGNRRHLLRLQNLISCESHREVLETVLDNKML
jgi:poly-gamma-glutamate synthesis protein (capsule biosynthesis protein)